MPSKQITDAFLRTVKPPKPKLVIDKRTGKEKKTNLQVTYLDTRERGRALALTVSYGGTKAFSVLTYVNGKPKFRKLGTYPAMSLKDAKAAVEAFYHDPKAFEAKAAPDTFREIAEDWFKRHVEGGELISARELRRHLETYVYPKWKDRKFAEIRRGDVNTLLDHVADNHGPSQADAVLATVRSIMTWYQSRNEHYTSPIVRGMKRDKRKPADRKRIRILSTEEIAALWTTAPQVHPAFGAIVKLLLLTAQRRDKVATMRWTDLSEDGVWTVRREAREKGTAGALKLPQTALAIIAELPRLEGNPYVFPGDASKRRRGEKKEHVALNSHSAAKAELDNKLAKEFPSSFQTRWVLHDLRRTAKSLMAKAGVLPHISERVLGHAIPGVEGVYDQHDYAPEKADALVRLEAAIKRIVEPPSSNVIHLERTG